MTQATGTVFAEPPIGPDGLLDITAIARRVEGGPEVKPSGVDLAALDRDTPAATTSPFAALTQQAAAPVDDHTLLVNEVAATEQSANPDLPEGACVVPLHNRTGDVIAELIVLHPDDWPSSINDAVNDPRRWTEWALTVLATDEARDLWRAVNPKNRETARFINDWNVASGNVPGKDDTSNASSPNTQRPLRAI